MAKDPNASDLLTILRTNPPITAAWLDRTKNPPILHMLSTAEPEPSLRAVDHNGSTLPILVPYSLADLPAVIHHQPKLNTLRLPLPCTEPSNAHQTCQNEPIRCGTQLQPAGAPWVGTAGAPVTWLDRQGNRRWGILSNAHVMVPPTPRLGHPQCQPTDASPPIAFLSDYDHPAAKGAAEIDAAVADAWLDGRHTIDRDILEIGTPNPEPITARPGLPAVKSGRTTGKTFAHCTAVGAAVQIDYGDFVATLINQDLYTDDDEPFSAPGDSGSLILSCPDLRPCSLLFAGGGNITVGNPVEPLARRFSLSFQL